MKLDEAELGRMEGLVSIVNPNDRRNWNEDRHHENGNYTCHCCICGNLFIGNKHRVVCKECDSFRAFIPAAIAEIRRLRRVLEFYGDKGNYYSALPNDDNQFSISTALETLEACSYITPIEKDGGKTAREALGEK